MRKCLFEIISGIAVALLLSAVSGCSSSLYDDAENWAILDNDTPAFYSQYDLIYLYPSQEEKCENGYLKWISGDVGRGVRNYARLAVSQQFGPRVRVFSPFVPLLGFNDYDAIIKEFKDGGRADFDFYKTKLAVPIDYMVEALNYYFDHYHADDIPVVLYGQGQGALVLYEAMKRCSKVRPDKGFVAGYFFGIPGVTCEALKDDLGGRGIKAAKKRDDVGVVVICNIRAPGEALEHTFAMPNGVVINPLNWRTDATPAGRGVNPGALFFDHKEHNPLLMVKQVPRFCGAVVDPENAVVNITNISKNSKYKLDEERLFSDALGLFTRSVSENAQDRVAMFKFVRTGVEMPE